MNTSLRRTKKTKPKKVHNQKKSNKKKTKEQKVFGKYREVNLEEHLSSPNDYKWKLKTNNGEQAVKDKIWWW